MTSNRLTTTAGWCLLVIAVLHTLVFAGHPYWPSWLTGDLRSGTASQTSVATFWALPAFVVPLVLLALQVIRIGRRKEPVPGYLGWALAAWVAGCGFLIGASGFLLGAIPAAFLVIAGFLPQPSEEGGSQVKRPKTRRSQRSGARS